MSLAELVAELPPPVVESGEVGPILETETPALLQSNLPDHYHEAYKLRLAGVPVGEIAQKFGKDRATIWRWAKAVETEFLDYLEKTPTFNVVGEQLKRLRDLEEENRKAAGRARSERAKAMFLQNAMKAVTAQNQLLLEVGIFERVPDRLFKVVASVRPTDPADTGKAKDTRTRQELIAEVLDKLSKSVVF